MKTIFTKPWKFGKMFAEVYLKEYIHFRGWDLSVCKKAAAVNGDISKSFISRGVVIVKQLCRWTSEFSRVKESHIGGPPDGSCEEYPPPPPTDANCYQLFYNYLNYTEFINDY